MSQGFLAAEPVTGGRTFGSLYAILRTNFQALQSAHSGTSWPASPVGGQLCWRTDYSPRKLFIYNDLGSTWDEMVLATAGLGLELVNARGALASLDQRLDVSTNEDGTLKAATSLNPSQWYVMPNTSTVLNTTTFKLTGADGTAVYHPTRRLKINRSSGGVAFTEVVSSSYSAPDTTVVVRDTVISNLVSVEHSIVAPRKASGGDGAVSYEMIASRGITSGGGNLNIGDSVVFANGAGTTTLQTVGNYGVGRPIFLVNIGGAPHTFAAFSGQYINAASSVTVGPGQSVIIFNNGSTWYRFDKPNVFSDWVDWTASASPTGFSSVNVSYVFYKVMGKTCFVYFKIDGTGSGVSSRITLPFYSATGQTLSYTAPIKLVDNGSALAASGMALIFYNDVYCNFYKDWNSGNLVGGSSRTIIGQIFYEIA